MLCDALPRPGQLTIGGLCLSALLVFGASPALGGPEPRFSLPLDCKINENCFIQSYVDIDPGPSARDYTCGGATYNGHDGVDFRLLSTEEVKKGVKVLAAATGIVKGVRDGMPDALIDDSNLQSVTGRECGNGVVVDHGDGWESQYCHMRKGSLRVKPGDRIARGQQLGEVGYSGLAQFAHVHFAVRRHGRKIDPFTGRGLDGSCAGGKKNENSLWIDADKPKFAYHPGQILELAFSSLVPQLDELEKSSSRIEPTTSSEMLIFYARLLNLRANDRIRLEIHGQGRFIAESVSEPLPRNKASYLAYIGKRRQGKEWADGQYIGKAEILRGEEIVEQGQRSFLLKQEAPR